MEVSTQGEREVSDRTSLKGLRPPGEWRGREASDRTSLKGLRPPGEWRGREASDGTSLKGLRPPGEWRGREASDGTSLKGQRLPTFLHRIYKTFLNHQTYALQFKQFNFFFDVLSTM